MRQKNPFTHVIYIASLSLYYAQASWADTAYFAGGCFWCMEAPFEKLQGVTNVVSGFTGGELENPTYKGDHSGHFEAIKVDYDPAIISYVELLNTFWKNVDPFDDGGQFCDRGDAYRAAVFTSNLQEHNSAVRSKERLQEIFLSIDASLVIKTPVLDVTRFWPVENYHQNYYKKNPIRYRFFRSRCGRDKRLKEISRLLKNADIPVSLDASIIEPVKREQ